MSKAQVNLAYGVQKEMSSIGIPMFNTDYGIYSRYNVDYPFTPFLKKAGSLNVGVGGNLPWIGSFYDLRMLNIANNTWDTGDQSNTTFKNHTGSTAATFGVHLLEGNFTVANNPYEKSKIGVQSALWNNKDAILGGTQQFFTAFLSILISREEIRLIEQSFKTSKELHDGFVLQKKLGEISGLQILYSESNLKTNELQIVEARRELERKFIQFYTVVNGKTPNQQELNKFSLEIPELKISSDCFNVADLVEVAPDDLLKLNLPRIRSLETALQSTAIDVAYNKNAMLPKLDLRVAKIWNNYAKQSPIDPFEGSYEDTSVGLQLEVPIGLQAEEGRLNQSQSRMEYLKASLDATKIETMSQWENTQRDYKSLLTRRDTVRNLQKIAVEKVTASKPLLNLGTYSKKEFFDNQLNLLNTNVQQLRIEVQLLQAKADLLFLSNNLRRFVESIDSCQK